MEFKHSSTMEIVTTWLHRCATDEEVFEMNNLVAERLHDWSFRAYYMDEIDDLFDGYSPSEILLAREDYKHFSVDDAVFFWTNGALVSAPNIKKLLLMMAQKQQNPYEVLVRQASFEEMPKRLQAIVKVWEENSVQYT